MSRTNGTDSIGCAIVTYNGAKHLPRCLPPLLNSRLTPKVIIIDSSSTDDTVKVAKEFGVQVVVILQKNFNHGSTRELARSSLRTDIVVMLTQDAYFADSSMLEKLVQPIVEKKASVAYARQIPHLGAGFFESFPREFNYPSSSEIRSIQDLDRYGTYTFFCSNSCAAYCNFSLGEIGGFPHVLLGEDTVAAAKLLRNGGKIAYVAESVVHHSHRYSLWQEFQRNFDTGFARNGYAKYLKGGSGDSRRGWLFARTMLITLAKQKPLLLPYGCVQIFAKWLGFFLGRNSLHAPKWFKKMMSSQRYYW